MWHVEVQPRGTAAAIITRHGYEDGKQVVNERIIEKGKNVGKSNETSPLGQAEYEARALWNKKRDAGYTEEGDTERTYTAPLPMLAHDYSKRKKAIVFPCYAQKKLDGVRCVAVTGKGLFSRNGKPASCHLSHILAEVNSLPEGTVLDGELYSDTLTFQEVVGLVKKKLALTAAETEKMSQIYLCVYDAIRDGTNSSRNDFLCDLFSTHSFTSLRLLNTEECRSAADITALHASYVAQGYEGLILRNKAGLYAIGHRSADLQKYKEFEDDEYEVCGFKEGDGTEKGCVIWICKTKSDVTFAVRPKGTHADRALALATADSMIGKMLTVRYQEFTNDGVPRFPVGIAFRDYEES